MIFGERENLSEEPGMRPGGTESKGDDTMAGESMVTLSGKKNDPYILTIDLGTSGPKVALFSAGGSMVDKEFAPVELLLFPHGGAEQRPEDWWRAVTTAVRRMLDRKPVPVEAITAISCTGQTGYTKYIAERARDLGAKVAVVTSISDSPLAGCGDPVIIVPAEAEDIVIRAAVFEHATSLCLDAVFNVLADQLKLDLHAYRQRHANLE